jgi:hypothetical protein
MKIFILEDNDYKYEDIVKVISETGPHDIDREICYNKGIRKLSHDKYDLAILDNTVPRYSDGNEMVTDAVENILWYLKLNKNDIPVIACSYYEGTTGQRGELEHLKVAYGLPEYVLYQEPGWEKKLKEYIEKYGKSS